MYLAQSFQGYLLVHLQLVQWTVLMSPWNCLRHGKCIMFSINLLSSHIMVIPQMRICQAPHLTLMIILKFLRWRPLEAEC